MNNRSHVSQSEVIRQLRLPMIVLVAFAHSYGAVGEGYSLLASEWNTYESLKLLVSQTLVKVAMPVFFIMSGYLFYANVDVWNFKVYKTKICRRIKTLLIPYSIWNLLMAVKLKSFSWSMLWAYWKPAGLQIDWFGREQLMTAPANMPLWFLRDLMVVSLLTPIIYILIRKMGLWLMAVLTVLYLSGVCAFIPGLSAYAVYFFTFGAFLSIRKMDLIASLKRVELSSYMLSILLAISMLEKYAGMTIPFVKWMIMGIPLTVVLLPVAWFLCVKVFKPAPLSREKINSYIDRVMTEIPGKMTGKEKYVLVILFAMLVLWIISSWVPVLNITAVALVGLMLYFLPGKMQIMNTDWILIKDLKIRRCRGLLKQFWQIELGFCLVGRFLFEINTKLFQTIKTRGLTHFLGF